jgi:hypothetical protein
MVTPGELGILIVLVLADHLINLVEVAKVDPLEELSLGKLAAGGWLLLADDPA